MTIDPEMEAQYNNQQLVPEAGELMAELEVASKAFRDTLQAAGRAELDCPYGPGGREKYDLFFPEGGADKARALVIYIHGGYWQWRDRKDFSAIGQGLIDDGFAVAMPSYDLCPDTTIPGIIDQMRIFTAHLWNRLKMPLIITGHSAGGHLTATLCATGWAAQGAGDIEILGAAPISGVFDLEPLVETTINGKLGLTNETARQASPLSWPPTIKAPMISVVGGAESDGFRDQSRQFAEHWAGNGIDIRYMEIGGTNHFTVVGELRSKDTALTQAIAGLAG